MYSMPSRRRYGLRLLASGFLGALLVSALAVGAGAGGLQGAGTVLCPLNAGELSTIVGKSVQRVDLGDPNGDPTAKCAFSAVSKSSSSRLVSPQVFLTTEPGDAADLRDLRLYYVGSRTKLVGHPRVSLRPDLGPGAFTLASTTEPVATAYFLVGKKSMGTLSVDLSDAGAGKRDQETVDRLFALVHNRLS